MPDDWPAFVVEDPAANFYYPVATTEFAEYILVADDRADPGRLVARAFLVPFARDSDSGADEPLPPDGWRGAIYRAWRTRRRGAIPNAVSALEVTVRPDVRGRGVSTRMLAAMRAHCSRLGFAELIAPVRPVAKHLEPHTPMHEYAARTRADGLPADSWLRTHVRAGGCIAGIAPHSMMVVGSLAQWRSWAGVEFDSSGTRVVPHALVPLHSDAANDFAVYVEPNVWVRHRLND